MRMEPELFLLNQSRNMTELDIIWEVELRCNDGSFIDTRNESVDGRLEKLIL